MSRPRVVYLLDVLIVVLFAAAAAIWFTGGFYTELFGFRVSARSADRAFLPALALALVRWRLRAGGFLGHPAERYRRWWNHAFQPDADTTPRAVQSSRSWRHPVLAAIGLAGIGAALLRAQLRQMDSVPDLGDPLFSIWRMEWVYRQLGGDPRPLFDANIFHPTPLTLTLSDSMLLPSLTASPVIAAGAGPVVAYNILLLSGFLLSGLATYFLVRRVTGSARAAFIGGLLYMFYPYRFEHYPHLELQMTQWMPLALLCLHRFAESFRPRDVILAGLCMVAQLYSSMYYGVFFVIYGAAVLGTLFAVSRTGWRRVVGPMAIAGVTAIALAIPLARPYIAAQALKGERDSSAVRFYSADVADYFRPHPRLAMYSGRLLADIHPERALFPGLTPLALSAVALAPPIGPIRLAYTTGLVVALDMSRGMKGLLYPYLYDLFPPLRGMRSAARFSVILAISLVVLGAFGARRLMARVRSPRARSAIFAALVVAVVIDLRPRLDLLPVWPTPPPIYNSLAGRSDVVLAEFPFELNPPISPNDLPFMYFSVWHGLPMVNGYSGYTPESHEKLVEDMRGFPDEVSLAALAARGATHVTVNCALMGESCQAFLEKVDQSPALRLLQSAEWERKEVRLYELVRK